MQAGVERRSERRAGSHRMIHELVNARAQMLTLFTELACVKPFSNEDPVPELLQEFCEVLVDYTATAHFQLYRFFEEKQERRDAVRHVAEEIYPVISRSTQAIVDFNDRYDASKKRLELDHLEDDLSQLGEMLAERIEMEDRLIAAMTQERATAESMS